MRIYKWLIGFILLGYMPLTWAQNYDDCFSCEDYFCNMRYHVYADYLYWKPYRSGIGVSIPGVTSEDAFLDPEYESGYRVGGRIIWNCLDLGVRYTSFDSTSRHFLLRDLLTSGLQQDEEPSNLKYRVDYQVVDVEVGYLFCFGCGNSFLRPFVGGKFAWIDETAVFNDGDLFIKQTIDDKGYGPYMGVEGKLGFFNVCDLAIGLRARGSYALLDSTQRIKLLEEDGSGFRFDDEPHLNTYVDLFIGLDLSYCGFSCFDANLQIGYELQSYLRDTFFFETIDADQISFFDSIGFGGLVVRFGVYF